MEDRIQIRVPNRIIELEKAIFEKDFDKFSEITMNDSDDMVKNFLFF